MVVFLVVGVEDGPNCKTPIKSFEVIEDANRFIVKCEAYDSLEPEYNDQPDDDPFWDLSDEWRANHPAGGAHDLYKVVEIELV